MECHASWTFHWKQKFQGRNLSKTRSSRHLDSRNRMAKWTPRNANSRKKSHEFSLSIGHQLLPLWIIMFCLPPLVTTVKSLNRPVWGVGGLHYTIHHQSSPGFSVSWVVIRDLSTLLMAGFNKKNWKDLTESITSTSCGRTLICKS